MKKSITFEISFICVYLGIVIFCSIFSFFISGTFFIKSVSTNVGAITLTIIP